MKTLSRILSAAAVLAAASCGGGGTGLSSGSGLADTGLGGSGGVTGPAQGFGSIIINDLVLDVDSAEFEIEGRSAGIGLTGQNLLAEGQQLVVRGDIEAREASEVFYRSDIMGPLAALPVFDALTGRGQLDVLGQVVKVNSATRYDGVSLDTLQPGDLLEISGTRDAQGALVATYVGHETSLDEYKVVGTASAVTSTGFSIAGLAVDTATNGLPVPPAGGAVEVRFPAAALATTPALPATAVEVLDGLELDEGERFEVQGFIDTFDSASRFTVAGIPVTVPAGVRFDDGSADDLELNARIEVEGSADSAGRLVAERIIFKADEAIRVEGAVSGVDLQARTVTTSVGLTFAVRGLTELEDDSDLGVEPFTLDDLMLGDYVEIRGFRDGSELVAAEIEREDPEAGQPTRLRAPADAAPAINDQGELELSLLGIQVRGVAAVTAFEDDDEGPVTLQAFAGLVAPGVIVEARWDAFTATSEAADGLAIEEEDD